MKNWTVILLGILTLISCERTNKDTLTKDKESTLIQQSKKFDNKEVPEKLLTLNTQPKIESTQENIDENLFGKFFCDRAEFYIIKNPKNKIYSSSPESITLYYLDGELRQTKYILDGNIVTNLLHDLGGFKITGLDFKNREIISGRQIIIKTEKGIIMNSKLDNYELKWTFGDKEIKYRVSADSKDKFVYVEKVKNYENEFKTIEKYCI
jgi:hypothetical protein